MEGSYVVVPDRMSYVNAYYALYERADLFREDLITCVGAEDVSTPEKVAQMFRNFPEYIEPKYYIDREGGKFLGVNFSCFPILEVKSYDRCYGRGAAERALKVYAERVSSKDRFDKWDCFQFIDLFRSEEEEKAWR